MGERQTLTQTETEKLQAKPQIYENKNAKLSISARIQYLKGHNRAIGKFKISKTIQDHRGS